MFKKITKTFKNKVKKEVNKVAKKVTLKLVKNLVSIAESELRKMVFRIGAKVEKNIFSNVQPFYFTDRSQNNPNINKTEEIYEAEYHYICNKCGEKDCTCRKNK